MDTKRIARTDLNLLVALQVLLEEQHVGKAAERLFITQSAMSKTLSRLRILFNDDLFTRSGQGIVPTPKALELYTELETILLGVDELVTDRQADPSHFSGKMVLSTLDFFSLPLLPSLISILCEEAPNLQIKVTQEIDIHKQEMAEGRVDISINGFRPDYIDDDFFVEPLLKTKPVILMKADHPLKSLDNITWEDIRKYPEVALKVPSTKYINDSWLRSYLMRHIDLTRIVLETADYLTALQTLANTETIMFAPRMSLTFVKQTQAITTVSLPAFESSDEMMIDVVMIYHRRTEKSQQHIWMREQIKKVFSEQRAIFSKREEDI